MFTETPQKIRPEHLRRDAFLYVRQSTLRQVFENTESSQRFKSTAAQVCRDHMATDCSDGTRCNLHVGERRERAVVRCTPKDSFPGIDLGDAEAMS